MIKTTAMLLDELRKFRAPVNKLARMVEKGDIFSVVRGLYTTDRDAAGHLLAASIYGPSYLSFDYALAYWHLIPEAVYVYTSATFAKKKKKQFETKFGLFTYRDIPQDAYPVGIQIMNEKGNHFLMAEPEKALCDKLYTLPPLSSRKDLENLLFNDLRIEHENFEKLNKEKLCYYAGLYRTTNHRLLIKLLRRAT